MKIIQWPAKILTKECKKIKFPLSEQNIQHIKDMIKHIDESQESDNEDKTGVGLAAPQIGLNLKMFYVNIPMENGVENYKEFLINPKLVGESESEVAINGGEGCLSINDKKFKTGGYVPRKFKIIITGYSYFQKKIVEITKVGYPAVVIQHEYDHICGKLFIHKINKKNPWVKKDNLILI